MKFLIVVWFLVWFERVWNIFYRTKALKLLKVTTRKLLIIPCRLFIASNEMCALLSSLISKILRDFTFFQHSRRFAMRMLMRNILTNEFVPHIWILDLEQLHTAILNIRISNWSSRAINIFIKLYLASTVTKDNILFWYSENALFKYSAEFLNI